MRQILPGPVASMTALAAAVVLVTSAAAVPGSAAVSHAAVGGAAASGAAAPLPAALAGAAGTSRDVLLLNGSRLLVRPSAGGPQVLGMVPPRGQRPPSMMTLENGGQTLELPAAALPYLGHGLSPELFTLGSLLREESGGRLPVTLSFSGRVPSLPGVTITKAGSGTARGYLTAAGAAAFGAALARQFAADHARGSYGRNGLFAGGVSVGLAGPPARAPRAHVTFPMHTVTITGTSLAGRPDTGDTVFLFDSDNADLSNDPLMFASNFYKGTAKFSLPAGHYWAIGIFQTRNAVHNVIVPQFTATGASTTVHMDARTADNHVQVTTPRPSVPSPFNFQVEILHPTPAGNAASFTWLGGSLFYNTTTAKPTVGSLREYTFVQLNKPPKAQGRPYQYNVAYADTSGLLGSQQHVVAASGLATVHSRYFSDVKTTGSFSRFGVFPAQLSSIFGVWFLPMRVPRTQTEYLGGTPGALWLDTYEQFGLAGGQADDWRTFHPGEQLTENWNAYPLHAGYNTNLIGAANGSPTLPSASRKGDTLTLAVMPFSDSTLGHVSASGFLGGLEFPYGKISGHYAISEDGVPLAHGNPLAADQAVDGAGEFYKQVTLTPQPGTVRFVLDASRTAKVYPLSTASRTVWTWPSRHESGSRLPAGWTCGLTVFGSPANGRSCAAEPMMTLGYSVAGESLLGTAPSGQQVIHLTVGHLQLASGATVTKAAMSVSFDGGRAWHPARITGRDGNYTATFTAPAGAKVTLRTSAADAAGGSVAETVTDAYQITS